MFKVNLIGELENLGVNGPFSDQMLHSICLGSQNLKLGMTSCPN